MISLFKYANINGSVDLLKCDFNTSYGSGNPSIIKHNGGYYMTFRSCEYAFFNFPKNHINKDYDTIWYPYQKFKSVPVNFYSYNHFAEYDPATNAVSLIKELNLCSDERNNFYNGAEDIRLSEDKYGGITLSYSVCDGDCISMNISKLDSDFNPEFLGKYIANDKWEKNWMPVCDNSERFVRKAFENVIELEYGVHRGKKEMIFKNHGNPDAALNYFGSTQLLPYKGGFLCLVHTKERTKIKERNVLRYMHKFVQLDKEFNILNESEWFVFLGTPIEFTCGMSIENEVLLLPVSIFDSVSFMIKLPLDSVSDLLNRKIQETENICFDEEYTEDFCKLLLPQIKTNHAAQITLNTFLGANTENKQEALKYYVHALCEIKEFKIQMWNGYTHMVLGEDTIVDVIKKLL